MNHSRTWLDFFLISGLAALGGIFSVPSIAQQGNSIRLEEVVVTAQRREQNLYDVPVSVAAISSQRLEDAGVNSTEDLAILAPSLSFNRHLATYQSAIRIRGIGTDVSAPTIEPSVSMVVDGVVMSRQGSFFAELADIERIEILRGPQSTLFGKNAVAGVISVVTKDPSMEVTEGAISAGYDGQGTWRTSGTVSGPLGDNLAGSLTGSYLSLGDNLVTNLNPDGPSLDGGESYILRGKLLWETDNATWKLIADYSDAEGPNTVRVPISFESDAVENLFDIGPVDDDNLNVSIDGGPFERHDFTSEDYGISLNGDIDLGGLTLTSITAYREWNSDNFIDVDQHDVLVTPSGYDDNVIIDGEVVSSGRFPLIGSSAVWGMIETDQFSQEIHLSSSGDDRFRWLVGGFYWTTGLDFDNRQVARLCPFNTEAPGFTGPPSADRADGDVEALTGTCTFPPPGGVQASSNTLYDVSTEYMAIFGQSDFDLTDSLTLTTGLRFQRDEFDYAIEGGLGGPDFLEGTTPRPAAPFSGSEKITEDVVTGRLALMYALSDSSNLYASYSRGYKGPGIDATANRLSFGEPLDSESTDSVEIGLRSSLLDGRATLFLTGFWQEFENLQQQAYDPDLQSLLAINAGESRQRGIEAEGNWLATENLRLGASLVYLDAEFTDFPNAICFEPRVLNTNCQYDANGIGFQELAGQPIAYAPDIVMTLSANYERPIGDNLLGLLGLNLRYTDEQQALLQQDPNGIMDSFTLVNLTAGVSTSDERIKVVGYVNNLLDERYGLWRRNYNFSGQVNPNPRDTTVHVVPRGAERIFGVRVNWSF